MRILLVEDNALLRKMVLEAFVDEGFDVVAAETGEQALERSREGSLDVLFTDIRLPGEITGWEIAEICREANPRLPVIYATGYSHSRPRPVPGAILFCKPYRTEQIVRIIRKLTSDNGRCGSP
jgi:CheY-like chemotaxis protein